MIADDILVIRMADPGKVAIIEKEIDAVNFAWAYLIRFKIEVQRLIDLIICFTRC